jgi:hypothetical protein
VRFREYSTGKLAMSILDTKTGSAFISLFLVFTSPLAIAAKTSDSIDDLNYESTYHSDSSNCSLDVSGHVLFNGGHARKLEVDIYSKLDYEQSEVPTSQDSQSVKIQGTTDAQVSFDGLYGGNFGQDMVIVWTLNKKKVVTALAVDYTSYACGYMVPEPPPPVIPPGPIEPPICISCESAL